MCAWGLLELDWRFIFSVHIDGKKVKCNRSLPMCFSGFATSFIIIYWHAECMYGLLVRCLVPQSTTDFRDACRPPLPHTTANSNMRCASERSMCCGIGCNVSASMLQRPQSYGVGHRAASRDWYGVRVDYSMVLDGRIVVYSVASDRTICFRGEQALLWHGSRPDMAQWTTLLLLDNRSAPHYSWSFRIAATAASSGPQQQQQCIAYGPACRINVQFQMQIHFNSFQN